MKNKAITIMCTILVILVAICLGYIIINSAIKNSHKGHIEITEEDPNSTEINQDTPQREERGQNINVNSRIGVKLKSLIKYSDMYSVDIANELAENGINSKVKLLIALDQMHRLSKYQTYIEYSEERRNTFVQQDNMNSVLENTFENSALDNKNVDGIVSYVDESKSYVILPRAFATGSMECVVDVPYKVTQYSDRLELLAYRVYITKTIEIADPETSITIDMYYDSSKANLAYTIKDDMEYTDSNQSDYIKNKIDTGVIPYANFKTVKYTFKPNGEEYRFSEFKLM